MPRIKLRNGGTTIPRCSDSGWIRHFVICQDLEERLNMQYMEAAQNPMDKCRIPRGTAKQMLLYEEAPVYRFFHRFRRKIAPLRQSLRACVYEITGSLPLHPEVRRSGQTDPQKETDAHRPPTTSQNEERRPAPER